MLSDLTRNNQDTIYKNECETIEIYEAMYCGESCYCMEYVPTEDKAVFNHEDHVLEAVLDRIRASRIVFSRGFRFLKKADVPGISLPLFLFAIYNELNIEDLSHAKLIIKRADKIADLRKSAVRRKGGVNTEGIDLIEAGDRRHILIEKGGIVTILDYKEPLYRMLTDRRLCGIMPSDKRHKVMVYDGNGKSTGKAIHLARLVLLLNTYYDQYGNDMDFWKSVLQLSDGIEEEASHVLANTWNCCDDNLMWMNKDTNREMYQYTNYFNGNYSMFAIAYDGVILTEILFASGYKSRFACETPEEYKNMQKELLGKDIVTVDGKRVSSLIKNKAVYTADGRILDMPEWARKKVNLVSESITREYVIHKIMAYSQNARRLIKDYHNGGGFIPWKSDRSIMSVGNIIVGLLPGLASLVKEGVR